MLCADADASSTSAAFCCVPSSMWVMALLISSMPALCSCEAVELSANLVTVTVVVRDSAGALVTDLTPAEFATVFTAKTVINHERADNGYEGRKARVS